MSVKGYVPYDIQLSGIDKPGVVLELAKLFYENGINIISQSSQINQGLITGVPSFSLSSRVLVPPKIKLEKFKDRLDKIISGTDMKVDMDMAQF